MKSFKLKLTPPLRAISAAMIFPLCALATPSITVDRVQQRYPWNGCVDIDYTIDGMDGDPADYRVDVVVSWQGDGGQMSCNAQNFLNRSGCDLPTADGSHRVTWDSAANGVDFVSDAASVTAKLVYDPIEPGEADYVIVDVSAGSKATCQYPVRLVRGDIPSSTFLHDVYRTDKIVLKRVNAGSFWMGTGVSNDGNVATDRKNVNRHYVTLTKDFFLGIFPVTQQQYINAVGSNPTSGNFRKAEQVDSPRWPVCGGVYHVLMRPEKDGGCLASNIINRTSFRGGHLEGFTLPTESQWEYACRAGTQTKYYWDSDAATDASKYMWASDNAEGLFHVVGTKLPNNWGFYDMLGNALEFCRDLYGTYPTGDEENPVVDPQGASSGTTYPARGGSRLHNYSSSNCGYREYSGASGKGNNDYAGFRLSAEFPDPTGTTVAETVSESTMGGLKFDLSTAAVRVYATLDGLLPFAWSSLADFAAGGADGQSAFAAVYSASGVDPADPSTWSVATVGDEVVSATGGEGVAAWTPGFKGLYLARLFVGDEEVASAAFDLRETEGLGDLVSLSGATVELEASAYRCTGYPIVPAVTVTLDGATLEAGKDFVVSCADNLHVGTATLTVLGSGGYSGSKAVTFDITPPVATTYEASEAAASAMNLATNDVLTIRSGRGEILKFAYNNDVLWPAGGVDAATKTARVSLAPIAGPTAEPTDWTVLSDLSGEGLTDWTVLNNGYFAAQLEPCTGGVYNEASSNALRRVLRIRGCNGLSVNVK